MLPYPARPDRLILKLRNFSRLITQSRKKSERGRSGREGLGPPDTQLPGGRGIDPSLAASSMQVSQSGYHGDKLRGPRALVPPPPEAAPALVDYLL